MKEHYNSLQYDVNKTVSSMLIAMLDKPTIVFTGLIRNNFSYNADDSPIINYAFSNWNYSLNIEANMGVQIRPI